METKQTGVGWLVNKLMKESTGYISLDALASYTEQALEMEKEQEQLVRKDSYNQGWLEATQYIFKKYKKQ